MSRKKRSFVSAQMVAERAGVSRSAVSRTFTDGASVAEPTRRKVLEAAAALGYHVNHLARGLREDSNIVCLVVADMTTPIRAQMIDALTRKLQAAGKITMVINTETDTESLTAALRQTLNYRADATVVLSGTPPASLIETCLANGQQVILINRDEKLSGSSNLGVDNAFGGREAFFLLHRAGCTKLGLVTSTAQTASLVEREQYFVRAAEAEGMTVNIVSAGPTSYASGQEAARRLFGRSNAPDGVFCVTDLLALGFMDTARRDFGLDIPKDLCVIGFDNIEQQGRGIAARRCAANCRKTADRPCSRLAQISSPRKALSLFKFKSLGGPSELGADSGNDCTAVQLRTVIKALR